MNVLRRVVWLGDLSRKAQVGAALRPANTAATARMCSYAFRPKCITRLRQVVRLFSPFALRMISFIPDRLHLYISHQATTFSNLSSLKI